MIAMGRGASYHDAMVPRRALPAALLALLAGCGGGLYLTLGEGYDDPPTVSLVAAVASAVPGQSIRLAAAASDDRGIEQLAFFRIEADGSATLLGVDIAAPYEWDTLIPAGARDSVRYFARASDTVGQRRDSATITVLVPP